MASLHPPARAMKPLDCLIAVIIMVLWGFNFVAAKWGLAEIPPIMLMALRFGLTAALLLPFTRIPWSKLRGIAVLSLVLGGLHFNLMFTGLSELDASTAAITVQTQVPFSAILAAMFFGDRLGWRRALGMTIAFAGVVVLAGEPRVEASLWPLTLVILAAFAWSVANILIKQLGAVDGNSLNAWLGLFAAPQLLFASLVLEDGQLAAVAEADGWAWASLAYMVLVVTLVTYWLWFRLLHRYPVNVVMPFTLLVPVFGVASGVVFLGEPLGWRLIIGGLATLVGVGIIVLRRPQLPDPEATARTT